MELSASVVVAVLSLVVPSSFSLSFISLLVFNVQSFKVRRACQVYQVERMAS